MLEEGISLEILCSSGCGDFSIIEIEFELQVGKDWDISLSFGPELDDTLLIFHGLTELQNEFFDGLAILLQLDPGHFLLDSGINLSLEVILRDHLHHLLSDIVFDCLVVHVALGCCQRQKGADHSRHDYDGSLGSITLTCQ